MILNIEKMDCWDSIVSFSMSFIHLDHYEWSLRFMLLVYIPVLLMQAWRDYDVSRDFKSVAFTCLNFF